MKTKLLLAMAVSLSANAAIEVEGHRGARARLPENTIPAMEYALKVGVDVLEMDLAVTKDRKLVLSHDPHVNKEICMAPGGGKIEGDGPLIFALNLEEVQKYDCGSVRNPKYPKQQPLPGTKIPSLDEVFAWVKKSKDPRAKTVRFNIETKIKPEHPEWTTTPEEFAKLVVETAKRHGMFQRTVLQSFDYRTLIAARKLDSRVKIAAVTENAQEDLVATAEKLKADILSPKYTLLKPEVVKTLHARKVKVVPWTPNTREEWERLIQMGVDRIITDDPEELIGYLKSRRP